MTNEIATAEATTADAAPTPCWCCGEERDESRLARLGCHNEVALCDGCLGWLSEQQAQRKGNRVHRAVPILATAALKRD